MKRGRLGFLPLLGREFFERRPWAFAEARLKGPDAVEKVFASGWLAKRLEVVHLPYSVSGRRLNVADLDASWREESISHIVETIRAASGLPRVRKYIVHPVSLDGWDGVKRGDFEAAVEGLREVVVRSERSLRGPVCLENNRVYYLGAGKTPSDTRVFGDNPHEWIRLADEVAHPLLRLCLDTSHAVTSAHLAPEADRESVLGEFLAAGERIEHVHWSANFLFEEKGKDDSHAALGTEGAQPLWFHRAVAELKASKTIEIPRLDKVEASLRWLEAAGMWNVPGE